MVKRIVARVGEYEKDGETKGEYVRIGVILSNDHGEYCLFDPAVNMAGVLTQQNLLNHSKGKKPSTKVMASIFSDDRSGSPRSAGGASDSGSPDINDEIPF